MTKTTHLVNLVKRKSRPSPSPRQFPLRSHHKLRKTPGNPSKARQARKKHRATMDMSGHLLTTTIQEGTNRPRALLEKRLFPLNHPQPISHWLTRSGTRTLILRVATMMMNRMTSPEAILHMSHLNLKSSIRETILKPILKMPRPRLPRIKQ